MHIAKTTQSSKLKVLKPIWKKLLSKEEIAYEKETIGKRYKTISAMNEAVKLLHRLPFSSTHNKHIRYFCRVVANTNYLENIELVSGASISDATFIPPIHSSINEFISDLEIFANDEISPRLI
jgi:hypothetical protein